MARACFLFFTHLDQTCLERPLNIRILTRPFSGHENVRPTQTALANSDSDAFLVPIDCFDASEPNLKDENKPTPDTLGSIDMFKTLFKCIFDIVVDVLALVDGTCTIGDGGHGIVVGEVNGRERHGDQ